MKYQLGTILEDGNGTRWAIVARNGYTASIHNERWGDAESTLQQISKNGKRFLKLRKHVTTDSMLWREYTFIRNAEVTINLESEQA